MPRLICRFDLDTKATTTPVCFLKPLQRTDLLRQQICGGADVVRSL